MKIILPDKKSFTKKVRCISITNKLKGENNGNKGFSFSKRR